MNQRNPRFGPVTVAGVRKPVTSESCDSKVRAHGPTALLTCIHNCQLRPLCPSAVLLVVYISWAEQMSLPSLAESERDSPSSCEHGATQLEQEEPDTQMLKLMCGLLGNCPVQSHCAHRLLKQLAIFYVTNFN